MKTRLSLVLPALAVVLSGCGTIMHGSTQEIAILSAPAGARVAVDSVATGRTPLTVRLPRKRAHEVRIEAAGYQPHETTLRRRISAWGWGNAFFAPLFVFVTVPVDASVGGLFALNPDQVRAVLTPSGDTLPPRDRSAGAPAPAGARPASRLERAVMVGSRVRARGPGGATRANGIVTAVRGDTLELLAVRGQVPLVLPLAHVEQLDLAVGRRSRGGIGAAIGLVAGGALGWTVGVSSYTPCEPAGWFDCWFHPESRDAAGMLGAAIGATGGAAMGLMIGMHITTERWERLPLDGLRVGVAPLPAGRMGLGASLAF